MMNTIQILERIERSIVGTATVSPRMPDVEIGKMVPCIRSSEDAEALMRSDFLDPTAPCEINLLSSPYTRKIMMRYYLSTGDSQAASLISARAAIGYIPTECLYKPNDTASKAIEKTGKISKIVSELRMKCSEKQFWIEVASDETYEKWLQELISEMSLVKCDLLSPPVPVVSKELPSSVTMQMKANIDVADNWERICGRKHREMGVIYSLHIAPNALDDPEILKKVIIGLREIFGSTDMRFWGIRIHFTSLNSITSKPLRVEAAKEFVQGVCDIASMYHGFVFVSDVGAIGPVFLDCGAAFASYSTAMTPRNLYFGGMNPNADFRILQYGKTLDLWKYNLFGYKEIERNGFKISDTGLTSNIVPISLRGGKKNRYRIEFGKRNNIAVMEKMNRLRHHELKLKNTRPGTTHIGKSKDKNIIPWA